jgi:hypothetical protein
MEARKCIVCGTKHWSRQPCPATKAAATELASQTVTNPPEAVTENTPPVTRNVTTNTPIPVTPPKRPRGRPPCGKALSNAERQRRFRERQKAANQ